MTTIVNINKPVYIKNYKAHIFFQQAIPFLAIHRNKTSNIVSNSAGTWCSPQYGLHLNSIKKELIINYSHS